MKLIRIFFFVLELSKFFFVIVYCRPTQLRDLNIKNNKIKKQNKIKIYKKIEKNNSITVKSLV